MGNCVNSLIRSFALKGELEGDVGSDYFVCVFFQMLTEITQ